jgi:S1-C subfamily serine protease
MKTKPVPTSPKVRNRKDVVDDIYKANEPKSFDRPMVKHRNGTLILVMAVLAGFFAGIFGETIINALAVAYPNLPVISSLYVSTYPTDGNVVIVKNEKTIKAQEYQLLSTLNQVQPAVVRIFEKKNINPDNTDLLNQNYQFGDSVGSALVLTDDGLLVTTDQIIPDLAKEYVAITSDKKVYLAESKTRDSATGLVFFRIAATDLLVAEFVDPHDLHVGKQVIALSNKANGLYESKLSAISDIVYYSANNSSDIIYSSEILSDKIRMADSLPSGYLGAPLVTNEGKIVGIAYSENDQLDLILPGEYIQKIIPDILTNAAPSRVYFGVSYIDLSRTTQLDVSIVGENKTGALVYGNDSLSITAVQDASPAKSAGLRENDIIISIEGKEVSANDSLSEIIQGFRAGEKVDLQFIRSGEKLTASDVVLREE